MNALDQSLTSDDDQRRALAFARQVQNFRERYKPEEYPDARDFEIELDLLLMQAQRAAQEPILRRFEQAMSAMSVAAYTLPFHPPAPQGVKVTSERDAGLRGKLPPKP